MAGARFTTWLGEDERTSLRELARKLHVSENYIVRMALRALLYDSPVPDYMTNQPRGKNDETRSGVR